MKRKHRRHHDEDEPEEEDDEEEEAGEDEVEEEEEEEEEKEKEKEPEITEPTETVMTTSIYGQERKLTKVPSYENYLLNYNKIYGSHFNNHKEQVDTDSETKITIEPTVFIKLPFIEVPFIGSAAEVNYHRAPKQCMFFSDL